MNLKQIVLSYTLLACGGLSLSVFASPPGWNSFQIPELDLPSGSVVDFGFLNTEPAGSHGFIRVKKNEFVDDRNVPLRFYGTNLTGTACFPDFSTGRKLAERLRRYGFNCLRIHFIDSTVHGSESSVWSDPQNGIYNEENLRRLDNLIAVCAQAGIYINLNLHVYRKYPGQPQNFTGGKKIDRWYPPYIQYQKEYARKMLLRRNTVSGKQYAEDPAIMCIELNNENTMIDDDRPLLQTLPPSIRSNFLEQWTAWRKHHAVEKTVSGTTAPVVTDANGWYLDTGENARATLTRGEEGGWHWRATRPGRSIWNLQLEIRNIFLHEGSYTVRFQARSKTSSQVLHNVILNGEPWQILGLHMECQLTPQWQDFEFDGDIAKAVNNTSQRVNFNLKNKKGEVEIRNYSIQPRLGQPAHPAHSLPPKNAPASLLDEYWAFLIDTEMSSTRELIRFLKDELHCKMPVVDTQVTYGFAAGILREGQLSDYVDIHAYWDHPHNFWDKSANRMVYGSNNSSALADKFGGCLAEAATWRVAGKPFSVSEYNVPAPHDYSADMFPMFSIMASIQNWNAFFSYTYRDFNRNFNRDFIEGNFQLAGRSNLLVHLPFSILLYRQYLMPAAQKQTVIGLPMANMPHMARKRQWMPWVLRGLGGQTTAAFSQRISVSLQDNLDAPKLLTGTGLPDYGKDGAIISDDGSFQICQDSSGAVWGTLNLPAARMLSGHTGGRRIPVGDVTFSVAARPWPRSLPAFSCITLIALDGLPIRSSQRMLIAASARTENSHMKWNQNRTALQDGQNGWGTPPTISEMVPAEVSLPGSGKITVTVLDGGGCRKNSRTCDAGKITIAKTDCSLWYLLER